MCIVVTPDLISEVLYILRVEFVDYPSCERLRTASKDELMSLFCETPSSWGGRQNTPCSTFAKGLRFLNMVMTFVLHPLSHYNSITKSRAQFLLSLLKRLTIDFPSHFILSLIESPSPSPVASKDEDDDGDSDGGDSDEDETASFSGDDEMTA